MTYCQEVRIGDRILTVWTEKGVDFPWQGALFTFTDPMTGKIVTMQASFKQWKGNLESESPPGAITIQIKERPRIK